MSPEYKVHVPEEKSKEFEATASQLEGVSFKRVGLSREDKGAELNKKLGLLRKKVQQITERKNPEIDVAIDDGFVELLKDALQPSDRDAAESVITELFPSLRERVCEMFLECTQTTPSKIRKTGIVEWPIGILRPKQVELLIEKYGLVDGKPKSNEEIASTEAKSKQHISYVIRSGLRRIRRKLLPQN